MTSPRNLLAKRHRKELIEKFGEKCQNSRCGATYDLEFAHVKPTGLRGRGRGRKERISDVRKHPECYRLLCGACHELFDDGGLELNENGEIVEVMG